MIQKNLKIGKKLTEKYYICHYLDIHQKMVECINSKIHLKIWRMVLWTPFSVLLQIESYG